MRRVIVLVTTVLFAAGCGPANPSPSPSASSAEAVAGAGCPAMQQAGHTVTFGSGLRGITLGTGHTGIVLAHQSGADVCSYAAIGAELAQKGYLVLAFDFNGAGTSELTAHPYDQDVADAASYLRSAGATSIVLMGASMGGTAVLVAATEITPPVAGVVSLSAPFGVPAVSANAMDTAAKLAVPVLYLCAEGDATFADAARSMKAATTHSPDARMLLLAGSVHGAGLINPGGDSAGRAAVSDFLARYAPVS